MTSSSRSAALAAIEKKYGKSALVNAREVAKVEKFSTGVLGLDLLLRGGIAYDRIAEFHGPASCGKTSVAFMAAENYLRAVPDGQAFFIDAESEFDPSYVVNFVSDENLDRFNYYRSCKAEDVQQYVFTAMGTPDPVFIIIDSIANVRSAAEFEKDEKDPGGSRQRGAHARAIGALCFGIINKLNMGDPRKNSRKAVLLLNQSRVNPGVLFADPEMTTGGRAKEHNVTQKIRFRRLSPIHEVPDKKKTPKIGYEVSATLEKTRVAGEDQERTSLHYYKRPHHGKLAHTFDDAADVVLYAVDRGVVVRKGTSLGFRGKTYKGMDGLLTSLRSDDALLRLMYQDTLAKMDPSGVVRKTGKMKLGRSK